MREGYRTWSVCVSVCLSGTKSPALRATERPTEGTYTASAQSGNMAFSLKSLTAGYKLPGIYSKA